VSQEKLPMEWGPEVERIEGPAPNQVVQISSTSVEVPPGSLWTVHWEAPVELSGLDLSFEAPNGKACVWGEHAGSSWDSEVAPETRRFTAWSLSPDQELEVPVASGSGRGLLVVEARPQILEDESPSLSSPSGVNSNLIYHFETDDGRVLSSGRAEVALAEEPYDRRVEPYSGWMGQPTRIALQHPSAATQVRFESDAPLDLRFLVPLPVEEERSSVYALPGGWTAQNASWELAPYVSLTPLQSQSLLSEQRLVRFDATVRPRRVLQSRPEGVQQTRSLVPKGQRIRHGVLETVRRPGSWREWHRTALGRTTRLNIPETGSLTVDYRTTASEPGVFTLLCNGEEFSHALNAEAGSFRLNGMPPNWNTCQLTAPGGDYFVNAPGSGRRWARRGLYRLTDTLEIEVDVPQGGTTVFVRVYTETGVRAAPLTLTIDDGRPVLRSGSTQFPSTPRQQRTPQRSGRTAQLIDRDEGALQAHRGLGITLGDDLVGSKHKVTIALPTGAEPVFVRFDSSAAPPREATADRHWYVDGEAP
ncbi:MAG: hypothetical protein VXW32_14815, partial [Myxococcota bacterium]|nr:hypothetical protein [Myxococcota bacterium]